MTTTPEAPEYVYETWGAMLLRVCKAAAGFIGIGLVVAFAMAGYEQLDINGYISHDQTTDVYMSDDWLVGENRLCSLTEFLDAKGKPTGKALGLWCPVEDKKLDPHNVSVTFKGILDPKDMGGHERPIPEQWACTRGIGSFVCHQMTTSAKP